MKRHHESQASDREILSSRIFNASREEVFEAWADPDQLKQWWGPKGFTNTFYEFDPKPGGMWRFTMYGPDGVDYRNESIFVEIVRPERIVFDHLTGPRFRVTAEFKERSGKTLLTWSMVFDTVAEYENVKSYVTEGNQQNLDRLEAHLALLS